MPTILPEVSRADRAVKEIDPTLRGKATPPDARVSPDSGVAGPHNPVMFVFKEYRHKLDIRPGRFRSRADVT